MRRTAVTAALAGLALLASGCQAKDTSTHVVASPPPTTPAIVQTSPPAAPTAVPTTAAPSPTPKYSPKPAAYDVRAVQTQLSALHYYFGALDGERRASFRSAVMAFQKVNGLRADGAVGPITLAALKAPKKPALRGKGSGTRIEVDLTRQVLYLVKGGVITRIMPVSSGNGKRYLTKKGNWATALTPVGYYKVQRRIRGERIADLGTLYDPEYFYKGWAIHGSNSVPAYPASHGCIRVTRSDAKYLLGAISVGTPVYVYGGKHTFPAGSSAPGTDDPGGDTPDTTTPVATPAPRPTASPTPAPKPSSSPSPSAAPTPSPSILPSP